MAPVQRGETPKEYLSSYKSYMGHMLLCRRPYVALQEAFFSRRQREKETLQEFSLALMGLMEKVKQCAPSHMPNSEALLRDQFVEHVLDSSLRSPSTFQRLMQHIFGDQQCQSLLLYLDYIVVFSSTVEQHLERLKLVLS